LLVFQQNWLNPSFHSIHSLVVFDDVLLLNFVSEKFIQLIIIGCFII
jgi:hypothetical protein